MKYALLLLAVIGCASVPTEEVRVVRVEIENQGFYDVTVRLNGQRIADVAGFHNQTVLVRESLLKDGRCATVSAHVIGGGTLGSTKECLSPSGGHFSIELTNNQSYLWLIPWAR